MHHASYMFARASLRGHPIHPMLVGFPIALFVVGFVALIVFVIGDDAFWFHASYRAMLLGAAIGVVAAVFGLVDLLAVARDTRAKQVGVFHASAAVTMMTLFASAGLVMRSDWTSTLDPARPLPYALALVLSTLGAVVVPVVGWLGWQLIGKYHLGVSPIPGRTDGIELPERLEHWP